MIEEYKQEGNIKSLHTACRGCVFSRYDAANAENGKPTQTGCYAGKLEQYRKIGGEDVVIEAEDGSTEFYIVNGRPCHYYRAANSKWAKEHKPEEFLEAVRKENTTKVDVITVIEDEIEPESLRPLVESLLAQSLRPNSLFVVNSSNTKTGKLHVWLSKNAGELRWHLTSMVDMAPLLKCVDEVFPKLTGHFYAIFDRGYAVPKRFIENIDRAINDRAEQYLMFRQLFHTNGLVMYIPFHKSFDGNKPGEAVAEDGVRVPLASIADKALHFCKAYNKENLIGEAEQLCNP